MATFLTSMATETETEPMSPNPYGYGLILCLNDDQCEALGITTPLSAGSVVTVTGRAFVKSARQSVEDDGDDTGTDVSLELQITDLAIGPAPAADRAARMYGAD